jgi:AraC-like DNA-binding protein
MQKKLPARVMWRDAAIGSHGIDLQVTDHVSECHLHHYHAEYGFAVIESGFKSIEISHHEHIVGPSTIIFIPPGEPYSGRPVGQGCTWSHRSFYVDVDTMRQIADGTLLGSAPFAQQLDLSTVLTDCPLARNMMLVHRTIERSVIEPILRQEAFAQLIESFVDRHARSTAGRCRPDARHPAIKRAIDCINARFEDASLNVDDLAHAASISKFHLMRNFRTAIGMTLHTYLTQVRVRAARDRLAAGEHATDVAIACGFFDQGHLIRHFKRIHGVTPGRYSVETRKQTRGSAENPALRN